MNDSLTLTGNLPFDAELDPIALVNHLASCLWNVNATTVDIHGNRVVFTRRMFRLVSNWNVLVPFERGDLTVDPDNRQGPILREHSRTGSAWHGSSRFNHHPHIGVA